MWLDFVLLFPALFLLPASGLFTLEVIAAAWPARKTPSDSLDAASAMGVDSLTVLVPAHDEAAGIEATIRRIRAQLGPRDRVLVVADNCTDETAAVAERAGADVAVRRDAARRGKGYALDFGVAHIDGDPTDGIMIVDADCRIEPGCIDAVKSALRAHGCPIQGVNLSVRSARDRDSPRHQIAEFTFKIKTMVRSRGLSRMGVGVHLTGTGMAFPRSVLRGATLATGSITEDLRLGIELAKQGHIARFCEAAVILSDFPSEEAAADQQRRRWVHGHVQSSLGPARRAVGQAIMSGDLRLAVLMFDAMLPPMSILAMAQVAFGGACALVLVFHPESVVAWLGVLSSLAWAVSLGLCWARFGRDIVPASRLWHLAWVAGRAIPLVLTGLFRSEKEWVRTRRDSEQ